LELARSATHELGLGALITVVISAVLTTDLLFARRGLSLLDDDLAERFEKLFAIAWRERLPETFEWQA
jgi:hypothetical protein